MKPSQQQLEQIVAYLDGELPAEESAQVEQQLAADEQFRQQLQGAQRAWAALDNLPMANVGDEFSRTTIEMVVAAARQDLKAKTIALPIQRRQRGATTAVLATMAVLLGALVFRVGWQNLNRRLLADLPVVHQVDIYSQFRSLDFLEELQSLLGDQAQLDPAEGELIEAKLAEFQQVSAVDNRKDWLEALPDDEKVSLRAKFNRFRDLSTEQQAELRNLHQQIEAADNREQLLRTMFRYQHWLSGMPLSKQYELRHQPALDRLREVAEIIETEASQRRFELTPQQLLDLKLAVRPYLLQVLRREFAQSSRRNREDWQSFSEPQRFRELFRTLRESPEQRQELQDIIANALPPEVRREFQALSLRERDRKVVGWLMRARAQSAHNRFSGQDQHPGQIPEQELADFFVEELDPAEKERLLALPRDKMEQQLTRLYFGQMLSRERRFPAEWVDRPPRPPGAPPEGRPRNRREEGRGPGPPPHDGPRRRPWLDDDPRQGPPHGAEQPRPFRRVPPGESPRSEIAAPDPGQ